MLCVFGYVDIGLCVSEIEMCLSYWVCSYVTWLPLPQGVVVVCVLWTHAHICHPTSHVEQCSCFPMQILFQVNWFYHKGFPCSHRWVSACCQYILVHQHLYICACYRELNGFCSLAFVACHLKVCLHLCLCVNTYTMHHVSTVELSCLLQSRVWSCIHRLPVGNFSNSRFGLYRSVWPEPCGTKQTIYVFLCLLIRSCLLSTAPMFYRISLSMFGRSVLLVLSLRRYHWSRTIMQWIVVLGGYCRGPHTF